MLGARFAQFLLKTAPHSISRLSFIPKYHLSMANLETTSLLQRTSLLPCNLVVKNILEMLQKIKDETEKAQEIDINSLSLIRSILRITHIKNTTRDDLALLQY